MLTIYRILKMYYLPSTFRKWPNSQTKLFLANSFQKCLMATLTLLTFPFSFWSDSRVTLGLFLFVTVNRKN